MALHPPPLIEDAVVLVTQRLQHSAVSRVAAITFSLSNSAAHTAQVIANNFQTVFNADLKANLDTEVTILPPFVNVGHGTTTPSQAIASGASSAGTRVITALTPNVSLLARKYTALGGRKNRGRTYFPWMLGQADVDQAGNVGAGVLGGIQTTLNSFMTDLAFDNIPMFITNKTLATDPVTGKKYVTEITLGQAVTSFIAEIPVATQRRRLIRA